MAIDERIYWSELIPERIEKTDLQQYVDSLPATEAGNMVHEWIEDEFHDEVPADFEGKVAWLDESEEVQRGKYDCFDGDFVYEFKTKSEHGMLTAPYPEDMRQVDEYMTALSCEDSILVYINRDDLTEVDEYLVPKQD